MTEKEVKQVNFFNLLSQELWTIDKHPFQRIGQAPKIQGARLTYDPSRVFKQQDQPEQQKDKDFLEFEQEQFENELKVQTELLSKQLRNKRDQRLAKVSQADFSRQRPYNPFNFQRGTCSRCETCGVYEGNFSLSPIDNIDVFECLQCGCPMNSHPAITPEKLFSKLIYKQIASRDVGEEHLSVGLAVVVFVEETGKAETHRKQLLQLVNEGGYSVMASRKLECWQWMHLMVEKMLFDRVSKRIDKGNFDSYLHFFKAMGRLPADPATIDFRQQAQDILEKVRLYLNLRQQTASSFPGLTEHHRLLCLLLKADNLTRLAKFLQATKGYYRPFSFVYSSKDKYEAAVDSQLLFPDFYQINYEAILVANPGTGVKAQQKLSDKTRDVLDFNNYIILAEDFSKLKRPKVENAFSFTNNSLMLDYVLGQHLVSQLVPYLDLKLTAKLGPQHINSLCRNTPNLIRLREPRCIQQILKQLQPNLLQSQRCALFLRPTLVKSNMDELVLNYFRLSNFTLISRVFVQLTREDAMFFALLENIGEEEREDYIELMMGGFVQVVLLSKRAALLEASVLATGARFGLKSNRTRLLRETPYIDVDVDGKSYREEIPIRHVGNFENQFPVFNGIKSLFDLQNLIFGQPVQVTSPVITDSSSGQLLPRAPPPPSAFPSCKLSSAILKQLNSEQFPYLLYTSTTETITEQIVNQFMPQCSLYESICVIVKPGWTHLSKQIRTHLELLRFKVVMSKMVLLSKGLASTLVNGLLVIRLDAETRAAIANKYSTEKVEVMCLSKVSGRREMLSYLSGFTLSQPEGSISPDEPLNDAKLKQLLVPVWSSQNLILQVLSPPLFSLQQSLSQLDRLHPEQQHSVLSYLCGTILGVSITTPPLTTPLGPLCYHLFTDQHPAKLQSWYYSLINKQHPHYVPLLYQYRRLGPKTVFSLQSAKGEEFIEHVLAACDREDPNRNSMVLYLWAKKLAAMVRDLQEVRVGMQGYGEIVRYREGGFRGKLIQEQLQEVIDNRVKEICKQLQGEKEILRAVTKMLSLRAYKDRLKPQNRRLVPTLTQESLRVISTSQLTRLHMLDTFSLIDPNHQLSSASDLTTLSLWNISPQLLPKYHLFAEVYVLLLGAAHQSTQAKQLNELLTLFVELSEKTVKTDLEMISVEIYMRLLEKTQQQENKRWALDVMRLGLPGLAARFGVLGEEVGMGAVDGKKRKFVGKKQYFIGREDQQKTSTDPQQLKSKYLYNVYQDTPQVLKNPLFDPNDATHNRWANQTRVVNLLRQPDPTKQPRPGVNVEYEKRISENEELIKAQVGKQVQKYLEHQEEEFLYETGLEKNVWYRRVRGEDKRTASASKPAGNGEVVKKQGPGSTVLQQALDKQVQMFLKFKKEKQAKQQEQQK